MTYDDIVEAQSKRDVKEGATTGARKGSRKRKNPANAERKRSRVEELENGRREIAELGLEEFCSVLQFCFFGFRELE
jgi:hypothetical protein